MRACYIGLTLLAACGPSSQNLMGAALQVEEGNAVQSAPVLPAEAERLPGFDWTGTWAATPDLCADGRWRFTRTGVSTDGETRCVGEPARISANDASLAFICQAEGITTRERWTLARTGKDGMRVRRTEGRRVIADIALRKCAG